MPIDPKKVFIVHGRNTRARDAMVNFLRAIGLDSLDFDEVKARLGGSEFVGNIVKKGMEDAQAVIVIYTPDEYSSLHPDLCSTEDPADEKNRWQPRPNVILEAGMALAIDEKRTILVVIGKVPLPSDLHGRHFIRLNNSVDARERLKGLLAGEAIRCAVDPNARRWHDLNVAGDFESCLKPPTLSEVSIQSPFR